jgi:uridine kinase
MEPQFDFKTGRRIGYEPVGSGEAGDVYILEGIQAVYPQVRQVLGRDFDFPTVFCRAESGILVRESGAVIDPDEVRLIRRLVRDYNYRNASAELTFLLWETVRRNEEKNIFPEIGECDFFVDSTHYFELNLFADPLRAVLSELPAGSVYRSRADDLLVRIAGVCGIGTDWIGQDSFFYEFLAR